MFSKSGGSRSSESVLLRAVVQVCRCAPAVELVVGGLAELASEQGTPRFLQLSGSARVFLELAYVGARRFGHLCSQLLFHR